ncbi:MAG: hypothetical protein ABIU18_03265 [Novosphingobium sp.]
MTGIAIQLGASLVAILAVAGLAVWLGLGGDVRLRDSDEARALARITHCGFDAVDVVLDRAGIGALLRDGEGRVMLLRRHGVHFAGRMLTDHRGIRLDHNFITVATADKNFGSVKLDLGPEAQAWAGTLRRLGTTP